MPASAHLLERAYQLINANQLENAELVLDAVVRVDPQNVKAWRTYLMIHQSQNDLDWLRDRILKASELNESDKNRLVDYYVHLTNRLNGTEEATFQGESFCAFPSHEVKGTDVTFETTTPQFELITSFDYPVRTVSRPQRREIYNPFDLSGVFEAISRSPIRSKLISEARKVIEQAGELVKNPREACARLSKSPHFKRYVEAGLVTLFILGACFVIIGQLLGYAFLAAFVWGVRWWLFKFGNHSTAPLSHGQARVYLHENDVSLPEIKEEEKEKE
jgi:hypothetical protein